MASIRIPCLVGKTNKAGITSWYWQPSATLAKAGWKPLTLGKDEGAAIAAARARNAEVEAWKLGGAKPSEIKTRVQTGTVAALIARYRKEVLNGKKPDGRPLLKPHTIKNYEISLNRIEAWAGAQPIAFVTPARVRALRNAIARPPAEGGLGHAAAFVLLKTARLLFAFAERIDLISKGSNPFTSFDLGAPPPRRAVWELDDDAAFDAAAYDLGMPSLALARAVALYSAQRSGDLRSFTEGQWQELHLHNPLLREIFAGAAKGSNEGKVMGWSLQQAKTSTDYQVVGLEIPFEPELAARVDGAIRQNRARDRAAVPPRLLTFVIVDDRTGRPWTSREFVKAWSKVLAHAAKRAARPHMTDLVWHDLRRTRVVRLRRAGMDPAMIASITGHSQAAINEMLKVYGPVDPTMTAAAIASTLEPREAKPAGEAKEQSA